MLVVTALAAFLALPHAPRPASAPAATPAAQGAQAPAPSGAELRARVETLLSGIDLPAHASDWQALGPAAVPLLEQVVRDRAQLSSRRAQAVFGLAALGGARARGLLLETARAEDERLSVRAAALEGLPRVLARGDVVPTLGPVLRGARSAAVRAVAADVLARAVPAAGCAEVRTQVAREAADTRGSFDRAAARCVPAQ